MKNILSMLVLALLAIMCAFFPKQAGRHIGQYDGLVVSEAMASNASAVPDANGGSDVIV